MADLYSVLGVTKSASSQEIKKAYRKLASRLHPDKNPGEANEKRFKEVTGAYEILGDDKKRKLYDEFGDVSLRAGFDEQQARAARNFRGNFGGGAGGDGVHFDMGDLFGGGGGFGDMLGDLFTRTRGQGAGPAQRMRRRGYDTTSSVKISFADAVRGTTLKLQPRGEGANEAMTVRIPAGAEDGSKVRVRGKGGPGVGGGPAGDLLISLEVEEHPFFRRQGDDLYLDLPVTLREAYDGAQVMVPTPAGVVRLTVPKRVQSGQKLRLRGKGVARKGKPAGDLYVLFHVRYPDNDEVAEAIKAIAKHEENPRDDIHF